MPYYTLPNQRPRAPRNYLQDWHPQALDCTRSVVHQEYCACDNYKVILLMCEQLLAIDRMQQEDVLAIIADDLQRPVHSPLPLYRPKAPDSWWEQWDSGDFYTQTESRIEYFAADCFKVIRLMCSQLQRYERLSATQVLAVIREDLARHFIEEDVA